MSSPRVLLVYPETPITFWSFDHALPIAGKGAVFPPLGLLTVAGLLPQGWDLRLVDMNVEPLLNDDLLWADVVLTSSMLIHWRPLEEIIRRCNRLRTPVLCGGPLPTQYWDEIDGDATFYLGEAENGVVEVIEALCDDNTSWRGRRTVEHRDAFLPLEHTPLPRWDLVDLGRYVAAVVQVTRGCPESCTFCNIPRLYGRSTRMKQGGRMMRELQRLYDNGWRGSVMVVDDNLIGNAEAIQRLLEEEIIPWQEAHGYPFHFHTQVSIRLSDAPDLMSAMRRAGFYKVFCGIESPAEESLKFMGARKNLQGERSLLEKVRVLQAHGFEVQAGFIVGFDTDPDDIAGRMVDFIQDAAIPVAMVGILGVVRDTPDHTRYRRQGRLREDVRYTGDTGLFSRNLSYVPLVDPEVIYDRHRDIVRAIYRPWRYFQRCLESLRRTPAPASRGSLSWWHLRAMLRSLWTQGLRGGGYRWHYWRFLARAACRKPARFVQAVEMAVAGHHLIVTTRRAIEVEQVRSFLDEAAEVLSDATERLQASARRGYADAVRSYGSLRTDLGEHTDWLWRRVDARLTDPGGDSEVAAQLASAVGEVADDLSRRYRDFRLHLREPLACLQVEVERVLAACAPVPEPVREG